MKNYFARFSRRASLSILNSNCRLSSSKTAVHPFESFLTGSSGSYVEDMYLAWRKAPDSVHKSWQSVFARMDAGLPAGATFVPPPSINAGASLHAASVPISSTVSNMVMGESDHTKVMQLIQAFQTRGHNVSDLDPLGMYDADLDGATPPDLQLENYGFSEADMEKEFNVGNMLQVNWLVVEESFDCFLPYSSKTA